jgi:type I restriction enzyme, S subunit
MTRQSKEKFSMQVMTENKFVPKLRFGNFDGEWELKTINDVCKLKAGKFVSASKISKEQEGGLFSCYGGNGLRGFTRTYTHEGSYSLIGRQGALCGNVKFVIGKFHATEHAIVVTPTNINNSHWLYYQFCRLNLNRYATGQAQPGLSVNVIEKVKASFPSLPEQQKIASFLSAVDKKLQQLTKKKELLEEYKKGVMQKIFSQELRFKDDNGNNYPDWEKKRLGEIAKVYQPKTISQTDLTEAGYDVYGANGIIGKYHSYNHEFHQIAVTCRGNTCGTVNFTKPYAWITGNAMVVNLDNSDYCNKQFVYFQLYNTNFRYLITGSGQPQITGDIKSHKLKLPSLDEQQKIANFLFSLDSKIELVSTQIENTKAFKKGLLQQMFV